jgi:hypothetical protein
LVEEKVLGKVDRVPPAAASRIFYVAALRAHTGEACETQEVIKGHEFVLKAGCVEALADFDGTDALLPPRR